VLAGKYTVTVEMMGFKKYSESGITLDVSDKLGLPPIALEVDLTGESVTVEANAVELQTLNAERSGIVTAAQVVDSAINGRNYTSLLKTIPGIAADGGTGDVNVNGGRTMQNNFTLDGQNVADIGVNQQLAYRISMDAIAEFKVSTSAQTAEFGRNDGAQVQVITKSGTQNFHGDGYWFKRGEFMNANTFTNNFSGIQRQIYRYLDAGFTLGGPIYIPKLPQRQLEFFVRGLDSKQTQNVPYGRADTSNNLGLTPFYAPTYGWSITTNAATIISPTLTTEFSIRLYGKWHSRRPTGGRESYYRSVSNINIPLL
jgi:hypothetical protein